MFHRIYKHLILCMLLFALIDPAQAKIKKVGQTGMQFLKMDHSARAAAMAGSYTLIGNDASAILYNPAGLAELEDQYHFFVNRTNWIADIAYNSGAIAADFGNFGTVGLSVVSADYGDIMGTRINSGNDLGYEDTGTLDVSAFAVGVAYSRALTDKFMVGGQVKYAAQQLGANVIPTRTDPDGSLQDNTVGGLAYDFGTIFYPGFRSFRFGMSVRDFSAEYKYQETGFQLPLTFRIGVAMDVLDLIGNIPNSTFNVGIDAIHPRDYTERVHIGGEYWYGDMIALRAGYKSNYDEEGLSLGFGINYELAGIKLKVDYAYTDFGLFNNVNRLSIGSSF